MDFNEAYYGGSGLLYTDVPLGFGMSLTMNEAALNGYAALTEAEKEKVIMRCKAARTKGESWSPWYRAPMCRKSSRRRRKRCPDMGIAFARDSVF